MIYKFEHEGFNVCGDCPCWHANYEMSNFGRCHLDFEERIRVNDVPKNCPMEGDE